MNFQEKCAIIHGAIMQLSSLFRKHYSYTVEVIPLDRSLNFIIRMANSSGAPGQESNSLKREWIIQLRSLLAEFPDIIVDYGNYYIDITVFYDVEPSSQP